MREPQPWPPPRYRRIAFAAGILLIILMVAFAIWFFSTTPRGQDSPSRIFPGAAAAGPPTLLAASGRALPAIFP